MHRQKPDTGKIRQGRAPAAARILVISLPGANERRQQVRAQLEGLGCAFEFFDASNGVQGAKLFAAVNSRNHLINTGRLPTPGEVGCYASHLRLWRNCVAENRAVCVLEDDCQLEEFFPSALESASQLIRRYGFIRLQTETRARKRFVCDTGGFALYRYTKMAHSTLAYVIDPAVARRFIAHSESMDCPVDVFIKRYWEHRNALYGLTPYAARESELATATSIRNRTRPPKTLMTRLERTAAKAHSFWHRIWFNRQLSRSLR